MVQVLGTAATTVQVEKLRRQLCGWRGEVAAGQSTLHVLCESIFNQIKDSNDMRIDPGLAQSIQQMSSTIQRHHRQEAGVIKPVCLFVVCQVRRFMFNYSVQQHHYDQGCSIFAGLTAIVGSIPAPQGEKEASVPVTAIKHLKSWGMLSSEVTVRANARFA